MANLYLGIVFFLVGLSFWFINSGQLGLGIGAILIAFVMGLFGDFLPKPKIAPLAELNERLQLLVLMQRTHIDRLYRTQSPFERSQIEKDLRSVNLEIEEISKKISTYNLERSADESTD